jgi:multidrug transporter EmrE-like cation transporter
MNNIYMLISYYWYIIAAFGSALPIPIIKKYNQTGNIKWLLLAAFIYLILIVAYANAIKNDNISVVYPIIQSMSIIIVVLAGFIFFHETLKTREIFGIIFGIIAIYLLT